MRPQIIVPDNTGLHNRSDYVARMEREKTHRDLSTVIVCPTRGLIPARVVQSWMGMLKPMNQKVLGPVFIEGMEVGAAYNSAVRMILDNPELSTWKFMLTVEEDNAPPPDGLLKLYESIDDYDAVGGLYWTKGELGQPMCYGDPKVAASFNPQIPAPEAVTECNGLGMGFTLFRLAMFKDERFGGEWFKTTPTQTQDLHFFARARSFGYRCACDSRVRVGHWDQAGGMMW